MLPGNPGWSAEKKTPVHSSSSASSALTEIRQSETLYGPAAGFPDSVGDLWMLWPPNIIYLLNISPFHLFEWLGPRRQSRYDMDGCRGAGGWPGGGYTEPWLPWWVVEVINDKWYQIIIILPAGDLFPPLRYFSSHNYSWLRLGRGGARRRYGSLIESEIFIFYFPKWVGI